MFNDEYLDRVYSGYARDNCLHLGNCKYLSGTLARFINDVILSSGRAETINYINNIDYSIITKIDGNNKSDRIEVFDYSKIHSYFQIKFPEKNTCIRCFVSPLEDNNIFFGYYSNFKPVKDYMFNKNVVVEQEAFTNIDTFNNPIFIMRMIDFLLGEEITNQDLTKKSILH